MGYWIGIKLFYIAQLKEYNICDEHCKCSKLKS